MRISVHILWGFLASGPNHKYSCGHRDFIVCTSSENSSTTNQSTFLNRLASLNKYRILLERTEKPFSQNSLKILTAGQLVLVF